jgi:N-methylhydantoinase B
MSFPRLLRTLLKALPAALFLCPVLAAERRPNVILILADDLGFRDLGSYGHPSLRTPVLDKLAADGIRLTGFHSGATVCTPSRMSLLTGAYPVRLGWTQGVVGYRMGIKDGMNPDALTIAEIFRAADYATAISGKWHIGSLPDGRYSFEDVLDNDGVKDELLTIALDMSVAGDRLTLDFSRTSAQCAGPVNISRATAVAACYVALKHVFPDVPANAGVLDAVDFVIPDGLVISASRPRPVGGYTETILRMIDVIFSATALADPKRAVAHAYGTINALSIAGHRTDDKRQGQRWVMFSFFGGGHGGHSDGDGLSHGNAPISTATIPPMEILEAAYPVRFTQWALRPGSGGDGQHRGGLGAIYEIELLEDSAEAFIFGERGKSAPKGIHGGQPALPNVFEYCQNGEWKTPPMVSKMLGIQLKKGDRVRLQTPGGGGWGNPVDRSEQDRASDVALGYTKEQA